MRIRVVAGGLVLALSVLLAGCAAPEPAPTPTPTGFASEAEAFAAAEATYRAYVDALNQVDLADPSTFDPVFALTTGGANAGARESFSKMHADRWTVSGISTVDKIIRLDFTANVARVAACLNVSDVRLADVEGESRVSPTRPDVQRVLVEAVPSSGTSTSARIAKLDGYEDENLCASS